MLNYTLPQDFVFKENALSQVSRCFILGNGPTLNKINLEKLQSEFTIGLNKILYTGFVPSILAISDPNCLDEKNCRLILESNVKIVTCPWVLRKLMAFDSRIIQNVLKNVYTYLPTSPFLPNKIDRSDVQSHAFIYDNIWEGEFDKTYWLHSVLGDLALPCAIYLGIKKIFLLAVDDYWEFSEKSATHFTSVEDKYASVALQNAQNHHINMNMLYSRLLLIANKRYGTEIYNLSPGSAILSFPKMDPDNVIDHLVKKEIKLNCDGLYIVILNSIFKIISTTLRDEIVYRFVNIYNNNILRHINGHLTTSSYLHNDKRLFYSSLFYLENGFTDIDSVCIISMNMKKYVVKHPYANEYRLQSISTSFNPVRSTFKLFNNIAEAMLKVNNIDHSYEELVLNSKKITNDNIIKYWQIKNKKINYTYNNIVHIDDPTIYQEKIYNIYHFDYAQSKRIVERYFQETSKKKQPMFSEHYYIFASLSCIENKKELPIRILELGTYNGAFTNFLSYLFPQSSIITIDLPTNSPIFRGMYGRNTEEKLHEFRKIRTDNLKGLHNVTFFEIESFMLPSLKLDKFDIIWVDAGHTIPDVCFDIVNSFHLIKDDGYILSDDVYIGEQISDNTAAYRTLSHLEKFQKLHTDYFIKRLYDPKQVNIKDVKFISISKKLQ